MAIDQESFNSRLYELLKVRGYKPVPKNSKNERSNPEQADVFEFTFNKDGQDYGKAWATIDQASQLKLYYDEEQAGSPPGKTPGLDYDDSWSGLLKHLKQWTLSKQLDFDLQDSDRLGDDMRQRDYYKMKERMDEGYHAVNKTTSYSDNIPNVKVIIQHDRQVQEGEQRWRNVHKIFVENTEGERFLVPTKRPGIARVYGRHVAEGGTPYDERGKHITQLVEEYTKMAGFIRATRNGEFTESVAQLVSEGVKHHKSLKETLQKMQSHRGYNHYFESWTPALMEDEHDPSIAEMFSHETIDPRIESVLPILNKLNRNIVAEMSEVNELEAWAQEITEGAKGCACCGCKTKAECTCPKTCTKCDCHKLDEEISDIKPEGPTYYSKNYYKRQNQDFKEKKKALQDLLLDPETAKDPMVKKAVQKAWLRLHHKMPKDLLEGEFNKIVVDAIEMDKEEFAKAHPNYADKHEEIVMAFSDVDKPRGEFQPELDLGGPKQPELELNEDEGLLSNAEIKDKVQRFLADVSKDGGDYQRIVKERIKWLKQEASKTKDPAKRTNFGKEAKMLMDFIKSGDIPDSGATTAPDSAVADAKSRLEKSATKDRKGPGKDHVTIGRALAGLAGALGPSFGINVPWSVTEEEQLDEFLPSGGPDDDRPKKGKLVYAETGEEIKLPATVKDFRGDPVEVVDFTPPHKPSSTGRIHTKDGMSYFPGVINAKIIDHDFDNLDEAEDLDFTDQEIKVAYGILNDKKYKGGDYDGAIDAIEKFAPGLSEHPSVQRALYATQNTPDDLETRADFKIDMLKKGLFPKDKDGSPLMKHPFFTDEVAKKSSKFKKVVKDKFGIDVIDEELDANQKRAGQLGPTGGPAKVGDLVGANESVDPYSEGSWIGDADRVYHTQGEEGLAAWLKMTEEELDAEINDMAQETGLHADDDRDELIFKVVQMLDMNRDVKDYGSAMREDAEQALADLKRFL